MKKTIQMTRTRAEWILLLIIACWGSTFLLTKQVMNELAVFNFMALRFLIGWAVLTLVCRILGKKIGVKEQLKAGIKTGLVLFLAFAFHTIGLSITTVAKNAFIVGGSVLFVPILASLFNREKQPLSIWVGTFIALMGLGLITLDGQQGGVNLGDIITLIGSILMAYYIVLVEQSVREQEPIAFTTLQMGVVGILSAGMSFMLEKPTAHLSNEAWESMLFMGIFCTALAYVVSNMAQQYIPASHIGLIYTLEPIFAAFLGWLFLKEIMGFQALIGSVLISTSVLLPHAEKWIRKQRVLREIAKEIRLKA